MKSTTSPSIGRLQVTALALVAALFLSVEAARADTLHATDDATVYLGGKKVKKNLGKSQTLVVNAKGERREVYLKFDASTVPEGVVVDKATLRLWVSKVKKPGAIEINRVEGLWNEDAIMGANAPLARVLLGTETLEISKTNVNDFVTFDLTDEVQAWIDEPDPDEIYGIVLAPAEGSSVNVTFDSKENVRTGHQPELEVVTSFGIGLRNLRLVTASGTAAAGVRTSVLANCDAGETVVSGGWIGQDVAIEGSRPIFSESAPAWVADFKNTTADDHTVQVYAICGTL